MVGSPHSDPRHCRSLGLKPSTTTDHLSGNYQRQRLLQYQALSSLFNQFQVGFFLIVVTLLISSEWLVASHISPTFGASCSPYRSKLLSGPLLIGISSSSLISAVPISPAWLFKPLRCVPCSVAFPHPKLCTTQSQAISLIYPEHISAYGAQSCPG